jgi:formate dehydrogenase (coenzyme F420) beta subunit
MDALRKKAKELLESGAVKVVIGYGPGTTANYVRPVFVRTAKEAEQLILNDHCVQNLATYLLKPEVKALGKPAIVAPKPALRTILQYAAENQIADDSFVALTVTDGGELKELPKLAAIEE